MNTAELLERIRTIEIKTRRLSNHLLAGEYHSRFKGRGMAFAEVRCYQPGDDVREIDWNVTARMNAPYVKLFEEERELTIVLLVDVSASGAFGTRGRSLRQLITEIAATLAMTASMNKDKVGVVCFSDRIEKYIPPQKGRKHILRIISELLQLTPKGKGTDVGKALSFVSGILHKRAITFLLSDLLDAPDFTHPLTLLTHRHELIVIRTMDAFMKQLPNVGLLQVTDLETGRERIIDTASAQVRAAFEREMEATEERWATTFRRLGVRYTTLTTDADFTPALMRLLSNG